MQLVLSLFPGADLFGKAFEAAGFCVVRAPDKLYGGDIREFHAIEGKFDGVIGGAPCQIFSKAKGKGETNAENLIPEFVRVVHEAKPKWAILENVCEAAPAVREVAASWRKVHLNDFDCGGYTYRRRAFWFYGIPAAPKPPKRLGQPAYSVLATSWMNRQRESQHSNIDMIEASRLQGYPDLAQKIYEAQPGGMSPDGKWRGVSKRSREILAIHMLGNGVPFAMGIYLAKWVQKVSESQQLAEIAGLPLFESVGGL